MHHHGAKEKCESGHDHIMEHILSNSSSQIIIGICYAFSNAFRLHDMLNRNEIHIQQPSKVYTVTLDNRIRISTFIIMN